MRVIIAGSRTFNDYILLCAVCSFEIKPDDEIVSGTAKGADKLGERYAADNNLTLHKFPADWNKHGKSAGIIRNIEMAKYSDKLIVFWDGETTGTKHMIDIANKYSLEIKVIRFNT